MIRAYDEHGYLDIDEEYDIEMAHRRAGWEQDAKANPERELVQCTQCGDWVDYYGHSTYCPPCYEGMVAIVDAVMA